MVSTVVDRSTRITLVKDVQIVVSPLCGGQPPPLKLASPFMELFGGVVRSIYGVDITTYLFDQKALGLAEMDPVLLLGQLPLESAHVALLLPYAGDPAGCISAYPTPALAAIAAISSSPRSIAVDFRLDVRGIAETVDAAMRAGVELQIIASRPLEVPGAVYLTESVPSYIRRRIVGAFRGNVDQHGEEFTPVVREPSGGPWREVEYRKAVDRVADVLGIRREALEEAAELGFLAYRTVLDLGIRPGQLGYLVKWGLLELAAGGFRVGAKLLYLLSL